jgi:hypothetical protein
MKSSRASSSMASSSSSRICRCTLVHVLVYTAMVFIMLVVYGFMTIGTHNESTKNTSPTAKKYHHEVNQPSAVKQPVRIESSTPKTNNVKNLPSTNPPSVTAPIETDMPKFDAVLEHLFELGAINPAVLIKKLEESDPFNMKLGPDILINPGKIVLRRSLCNLCRNNP